MRIIITIVLFGIALTGWTQQNIHTETTSTQNALYYQHFFSRSVHKKLSFFNLSSIKNDYQSSASNSYLMDNMLLFPLSKKIKGVAEAGISNKGSFAAVGIQYARFNPSYSVLIYPNIKRSSTTQFLNRVLLEYKPKLTLQLRGYIRYQFTYTTNLTCSTYTNLIRVGIQNQRNTRIGIGLPWFNPFQKSIELESLGFFIGLSI